MEWNKRPGGCESDRLWKSLRIWSTHGDHSGYGNIFSILKPTLFIVLVGFVVVLGIAFLVSYAISYRFTKTGHQDDPKHTGLWKPESEVRMEDSSITLLDMIMKYNLKYKK